MNLPENPEKEEQGQGLVEYALLIALIAVIVIAILTILGPQINLVFARVMGGFHGDEINVANGDRAVIVSFELNSGCTQLSNVRFVGVDSNGQIITDANVVAQVYSNGQHRGAINGTASGSGLVTVSTVGAPMTGCNITLR